MLLTTNMLMDKFSNYGNPKTKISRLVKAGELVPVRRGLYETDAKTPGYCLAASIYGPSYLSFEYALFRHGLIPEQARVYSSATCGKRKTKNYETAFGRFEYRDVPVAAFPYEVECLREGEYHYWLASPEKALCDQLHKYSPFESQKNLELLLFEDLRVDEDAFAELDSGTIECLASLYRSSNVSLLAAYLKRRMRTWTP